MLDTKCFYRVLCTHFKVVGVFFVDLRLICCCVRWKGKLEFGSVFWPFHSTRQFVWKWQHLTKIRCSNLMILSAWPMVATGTVRCLPSLPAWKRTRLQISLPPKNEHVPKNRPFYKGNFILILDMIVFGEVPVLGIPNKVTISNGWLNFARKHDRIHQVAQAQAATPPAWLTVISRRCLEWFKEGLFHWAQHVPSSPMWKEHWLQK